MPPDDKAHSYSLNDKILEAQTQSAKQNKVVEQKGREEEVL